MRMQLVVGRHTVAVYLYVKYTDYVIFILPLNTDIH